MYKITIQTLSGTEKTLYFPGNEEYTVTSAVLSLKVGSAGEFNFTVPLGNPLYSEIQDHSIITVYEDNAEIWRGDIRDIQQTFDKSLAVYALEDLAWLGDETVPMVAVTNETYLQRFAAVMTAYNSEQVAKRQIQQGQLTSVTTSNMCTWNPQYEETLLDCIRRCIADDGYLKIRRVTSGGVVTRYLDILRLEDYGQQATQEIRFGSNLLDFVKDIDDTNFLNVLYPYGAETDEPLYGDIMKRMVGTPIENQASISAFGRHARSVVFETESLAKLNSLALSYLNRYSQPNLKMQIKAVDLGNIELVARFHIGDSVRIVAEEFGIDQNAYITNQELDLLDIANNQIDLGDSVRVNSLTSQVLGNTQDLKEARTPLSILDAAKQNAFNILTGENGGIVTFATNENDQIVELLIANNLDIEQATKAWRWNLSGLAYLHRQYVTDDWSVGIAATMDGGFVADYITTGNLNANLLTTGTIQAARIISLNPGTVINTDNDTLSDLALKSGTIVDVDVEYAKNQSSTTAPTTGWSTSSPQWEAGYYIWQRTKTIDGNNTASYSTPVCIQGADGQTGVGVSDIAEQYYLSTSDASPTGGSWQSTCPTWVSGKYIWTRSQITWTDSNVTYTTPILAQAENQANQSVATLDSALDQQGVYDRLTNYSQNEGIYLQNGHVYVNASMINTGTLTADRIKGGILVLGDTEGTKLFVRDENGVYLGGIEDAWYVNELYIYGVGNAYGFNDIPLMAGGDGWRNMAITNSSQSRTMTFAYRPYIRGQIKDIDRVEDDYPYWEIAYGLELFDANGDKIEDYYAALGSSQLKYRDAVHTTPLSFATIDVGANEWAGYYMATSNEITKIPKNFGRESDEYIQITLTVDNMQTLYNHGVRRLRFRVTYEGYVGGLTADGIYGNHRGTFNGYANIYDQAANLLVDAASREMHLVSDANNKIDIAYDDITQTVSGTAKHPIWSASDERVKEDIEPLDVDLSKNLIDATRPKRFKFKNTDGIHYGVTAQDMREILDNIGETDSELEHSMGLSEEKTGLDDERMVEYLEFIPHLINYVKDLRAEVVSLKNEVRILKEERKNG